MEIQVLESIFRDIRELDRDYIAQFNSWPPEQKNAWSASFFNTVEYLCFRVNHRITKNDALRKFFFYEALPAWRKMFDEHVKQGILRDSDTMFPELKKAYRSITRVGAMWRHKGDSAQTPMRGCGSFQSKGA